MKIKIKHQIFIFKKWFCYSLSVILIGIFLLPNTAYYSSITEEKIIELTNQERVSKKLNTITANQLLAKAAYEKGQAILEAQNFQHNINGKKFSVWVKDAGYQYSYVGENLAIDFITSEGVIKAWLDSPTHKKNILNEKFSEIGVAIIEGEFQGNNTTLVVQIFGSPLNINSIAKKSNNSFLALNSSLSSSKVISETINFNNANDNLPLIQNTQFILGDTESTDLINQKIEENLLTHSADYPGNNNSYITNTDFTYLPVDNIEYIKYNNLNIRQKVNNLIYVIGNAKLVLKRNNFFINGPDKLIIIKYFILFSILTIIIIYFYLYYFKNLSYFKTLLHRKK